MAANKPDIVKGAHWENESFNIYNICQNSSDIESNESILETIESFNPQSWDTVEHKNHTLYN